MAGTLKRQATNTAIKATETASSLQTEETRQKIKDGLWNGVESTKGKLIETNEKVGKMTTDTMDWTAEKLSKGYGQVYDRSYAAGEAFRDKLDETGLTDRASQAA